jgi:hypothetical protein
MKEYMMLRHLVGVLALSAVSVTQVQAATCASPAEASVFDVAALKSMLMVMATGCSGDDTSYNAVINRYRPELVTNDAQLNEYFKKQYGPRNWQREHDAYITSLANAQADAGLKLGSDMCPRDAALFKEVMALRGPQDLSDYAAAKDLVPTSLGACVAPEPPARPAPRRIVHATRKEH